MKLFLLITGGLTIVIIICVLIGYLLPVEHVASVTVTVNASTEKVWTRLIDVKDYPVWRKGLKRVELRNENEWIEFKSDHDKLPFKIIVKIPFSKLVTEINTHDLPFGGIWQFNLQPIGNATKIVITENGKVYNPVYRFISRFIIGHTTTLNEYANDLKGSF